MAMSKFRKRLIEALGGYTTPPLSLQEQKIAIEPLNITPYGASYYEAFPPYAPLEIIEREVKRALIGKLMDDIEVHRKERPDGGMLYWAEIKVLEQKGE